MCSNQYALIRKYDIMMCRQCVRQYADQVRIPPIYILPVLSLPPAFHPASDALGPSCVPTKRVKWVRPPREDKNLQKMGTFLPYVREEHISSHPTPSLLPSSAVLQIGFKKLR